ncbi:MAG: CDP-alcohol phosphatidyltransferase family protein [Pseudomonadota bacterium]
MSVHWLPNAISVMRILLVIPAVSFMLRAEYATALALVGIAAISDGLDGFLARRFDWTSRLGAFLDPIADKLLVAALYVTLTLAGAIPLWLLAVVVLRDLVIVTGAMCYRYVVGPLEMAPTRISKTNTAAQFLLVLLSLLSLVVSSALAEDLRALIDPYGFILVAVLSLSSGSQYVLSWSRRALKERRERQHAGLQ